jgi:hypothetical protein
VRRLDTLAPILPASYAPVARALCAAVRRATEPAYAALAAELGIRGLVVAAPAPPAARAPAGCARAPPVMRAVADFEAVMPLLRPLSVRPRAPPTTSRPVSTAGWTRRVHFVREEGGGGAFPRGQAAGRQRARPLAGGASAAETARFRGQVYIFYDPVLFVRLCRLLRAGPLAPADVKDVPPYVHEVLVQLMGALIMIP